MATSRDPMVELTRNVDEMFLGFHRQLDLLKEKFLRNMKESIAKQPRTAERKPASSQTEEPRADAENEIESEFQLVELPDCFDLNKPWKKADENSADGDDHEEEDEDVNIKEWEDSFQRCADSDTGQQQQQQQDRDIQIDACLIDLLNLDSNETEGDEKTPTSTEEPVPSTSSAPVESQTPSAWCASARPRYPDHNPGQPSYPTAPIYPTMPTYPGQYAYRPNSYVPRLNDQQTWQTPQLPPSIVQHMQTPVWYPPQQMWRPNAPLAQYLQFVTHQG